MDDGGSLRLVSRQKRSHKDFMMDEEELEEPDSDIEECSIKKLYKTQLQNLMIFQAPVTALVPGRTANCLPLALQEPDVLLNKKSHHSGNSGSQPEPYGAVSSDFTSAYSVCMPQDRWGITGREEPSPSSMLEYWVYLDNQHNTADSPLTRTITPPATPVTQRPCPFIHTPSLTASTMNSAVNHMIDTYSPISSSCSPTGSARDTLRSISRSPGCSDWDPVSAAAHLHLLGESLSLIGHHLRETNKLVSMSASLSLLLDSLLCALAPLICLTAEIPELRSCTQHTKASTLENIAYVMPGM